GLVPPEGGDGAARGRCFIVITQLDPLAGRGNFSSDVLGMTGGANAGIHAEGRAMSHAHTIWNFGHLATRARREDLLAEFVRRYGYVVQDGIFAGTVLSKRICWGDGDLLPKLLGFYEEELHASLSAIVADSPDLIVNIGA